MSLVINCTLACGAFAAVALLALRLTARPSKQTTRAPWPPRPCTCPHCLCRKTEWAVVTLERGVVSWHNTQEIAEREAEIYHSRATPDDLVFVQPWPAKDERVQAKEPQQHLPLQVPRPAQRRTQH